MRYRISTTEKSPPTTDVYLRRLRRKFGDDAVTVVETNDDHTATTVELDVAEADMLPGSVKVEVVKTTKSKK